MAAHAAMTPRASMAWSAAAIAATPRATAASPAPAPAPRARPVAHKGSRATIAAAASARATARAPRSTTARQVAIALWPTPPPVRRGSPAARSLAAMPATASARTPAGVSEGDETYPDQTSVAIVHGGQGFSKTLSKTVGLCPAAQSTMQQFQTETKRGFGPEAVVAIGSFHLGLIRPQDPR